VIGCTNKGNTRKRNRNKPLPLEKAFLSVSPYKRKQNKDELIEIDNLTHRGNYRIMIQCITADGLGLIQQL